MTTGRTAMPESQTVEIKMMQRHSDCDINAMLFYVFYLLKHNDDLVLDENFEKDFISKCFYCGCVNEQSGKDVSYFVIPKVSFAIFVNCIVNYYRDDPDYKESYMEQIFVDTFNALQNGLRTDKKEKVIIFDEKETKFIIPQRYLKDNDYLREFIRPFLKLNDRIISKFYKKPDDLLLLYNTIKKIMAYDKDLRFLYTLYDNKPPVIPENINKKFTYCKIKYRKRYKLCATKNYVQHKINEAGNKAYIDFNDKLIKKFYHFIGL